MDEHYPVDDNEYRERPAPLHANQGGSKKRWLIIACAVAGVLIIGGAVYWFALRKPAPAPAPKTTSANSEEQDATPVSTEPVTFKSTKLGMAVTYANGWKVRENADKSEVILTSPKTSYARKDGTSTEGVFTIKLRHGVLPEAMPETVQKAFAVRDSEVIAYAQPTAEQRQYTNVTYAGGDANTFGFFIVSGNTSLKAGQGVGATIDLNGTVYLIAGGFGADETDALAFDPATKDALDNAVFEQAMDIVKSVQID